MTTRRHHRTGSLPTVATDEIPVDEAKAPERSDADLKTPAKSSKSSTASATNSDNGSTDDDSPTKGQIAPAFRQLKKGCYEVADSIRDVGVAVTDMVDDKSKEWIQLSDKQANKANDAFTTIANSSTAIASAFTAIARIFQLSFCVYVIHALPATLDESLAAWKRVFENATLTGVIANLVVASIGLVGVKYSLDRSARSAPEKEERRIQAKEKEVEEKVKADRKRAEEKKNKMQFRHDLKMAELETKQKLKIQANEQQLKSRWFARRRG